MAYNWQDGELITAEKLNNTSGGTSDNIIYTIKAEDLVLNNGMGLKGSAIELIAEKTSAILCIDYTTLPASNSGIKYYYLSTQKSTNNATRLIKEVDFSYKALDEEQF